MVLSLLFAVMPDGVTTCSRAMEDQLSHHSERLDRIESTLAEMKQSHADSIERLQQTLSELLLRYNRPERSDFAPPLLPLPTTPPPPPFLAPSLNAPDPHPDDPLDELDEAPPPALDPGDHFEISDPNPDNSVDAHVEDLPLAVDPGEHQELYATSHLHPLKITETTEDCSLPDLQASLAACLMLCPKYNAFEKVAWFCSAKYHHLSGSGSKSVHWIAQFAQEMVFDARQAQGGGR